MRWKQWILGAVVAVAVAVLASCHATGPTFTVDTTADTVDAAPGDGVCDDGTGACSLRAAVMEANALPGVDAIELAAGTTYTLTLAGTGEDGGATGDLDIVEGVDLEGDGSTIDAAGIDRILDVQAPSGLVYVAGITLTGGAAPDGAAIWQRGGATLLTQSTHITGSNATAGAPVSVTAGKLSMLVSTISTTTGTTAGAVSTTGGAVDLAGTTVSGTTATAGATIVNGTGATTKVDESTITDNTTTTGALDDPGAGMTLLRSIIADQASGADCATTITSGGNNVVSDASCALAGTGDQQGVDADLGALLTGEGPVPVHVPGPASAALDASTGTCRTSLDARLQPRPQGSACDAGAIEIRSYTVDSGADTTDTTPGDGTCADTNGDCTLRAAIGETNALPGTDHILIDPAVTTITLSRAGGDDTNSAGDLDVTDGLVIAGNGATIDQAANDRVLQMTSAATAVVLRDLTITGGDTTGVPQGSGGGISSAAPTTLERVTLADNVTSGNGGGINASAHLSVTDSAITGNTTPATGAGINAQGGLTMVNTTVSGNTSNGASNGAVRMFTGTAAITASTIAGNTGSGLQIGASLTLSSTILADNTAGSCNGSGAYGEYNVVSDATCPSWWLTGPGNQLSTDPQLGALADNGGPTLTHLPDATGPAAGAVPAGTAGLCDGTIATDQRGVARPLGLACDAGAVEVLDFGDTLVVDDGGDSTDAVPGDAFCDDGTGACTLRAAIMEANALPGAQTLDVTVPSVTLSLTDSSDAGGDLDITDELVIDGNGATITQTVATQRVVEVGTTAGSFTATDLTITGGNSPLNDGGGLYLRVPTTLTGVTVAGNVAKSGGGISASNTALTISDSTVSGNTAEDGGGIQGGPVLATNVTISGNTATSGTGGWRVSGTSGSQLRHSTVAANSGTTAGNLRAQSSLAPLELTASIVADPAAGANCVDAQYTSGGHNVVESGNCAGIDPTDVVADPALGALADNGGPTLTHLPDVASSPAIDLVPTGTGPCDGTIATDQRDTARPVGVGCDAGAVEVAAGYLTVDAGGDTVDASAGDGTCADATGDCTLRAAVLEANALAGTQRIHVAVPAVTLSLAGSDADGGDLDVTGAVIIEGDGATVTQTVADRVVEATGGTLVVRDLTITGGDTTSTGGGMRLAVPSTLERVTVAGNSSDQGGGGIVHPAAITVVDSTISGNTAATGGGGIYANAALTLISSTVSGNTAGNGYGGGVTTGAGTATIIASTITANTGNNLAGSVDLLGSVVAAPATGSDCSGPAPTSSGWNIVSDASCSFASTGDQTSTDPLLGALADNGGSTLTHLPGVGSPAIDAIPSGTTGLCDGTVAADQRGIARPQGSACDVGSVEQ